MISCQTSCTNECVSFFLSTTPGDEVLGVSNRLTGPVTTSAVLGSRGDAGGVSDVGPVLVTVSVLVSTDPSADCFKMSRVRRLQELAYNCGTGKVTELSLTKTNLYLHKLLSMLKS